MRVACACALFVIAAVRADLSLRDAPITTSLPPYYLDGAWTATEATLGLSIPATVPGDIITDLQRAGVVGDPWYELNWLDNRTLWSPNSTAWVFSASNVTLTPPGAPPGSALLLVFEGIKMGARVSINGVLLGNATNQHVRYVFPIPSDAVLPAGNRIEVAFDLSLTVRCDMGAQSPVWLGFRGCGGWVWVYLGGGAWL
jgi:beta-mannosidase